MTGKTKSRRQQMIDDIDKGENLDPKPVELPAGARTPGAKSMAAQIQEQIAIQIAKKQQGV